MVDDPYTFGQVAAANALSDVYAMGGEPKIALNIVEFPGELDSDILGEILRGGADKVREAGAVLVGGHSIQDDVPKYGLAVTGFVHPDQIYKNYGCWEGDVLILTKQLGSGIVNTAVKAQLASEESAREVVRVMTSLNKKAKETARKFTVHACTDVTGFGLLGHCSEMAEASGAVIRINVEDVAYMHGVKEYAQMGLIPGGAYRNRKHVAPMLDTGNLEVSGPDAWNAEAGGTDAGGPDEMWLDLLCDPQTSGGLLIAVPEEEAGSMLEEFERTGMETKVSVVGRVLKSGCERGRICIRKGK